MENVLFISEYAAPYGGNFIASFRELSKRLKNNYQYNSIYVFPKDAKNRFWSKTLMEDGFRVIFRDFSLNIIAAFRMLIWIKSNNVKIVHINFGRIYYAMLIKLICPNIKVIWHIHSDFKYNKKTSNKIKDFIRYDFFSYFIKMISVSEAIAKKSSLITYIPNGIVQERLCSGIESNIILKKNVNERIILSFGWSPFVKGVDIAVKSVALLIKEIPNIRLCIVCGRNITVSKMKEYILEELDIEELPEWITLLDPIENVYFYHDQASIILSSSRSEGFSYTILEALCLGKKCVISNIPGVQWARKYSLSYFFETENIVDCKEKLAVALSSVIDNRKIMKEVSSDYSIDRWIYNIIHDAYEL